jgi:D-alanyl-lipoteichoic acid acyltransferase DltB (MBOAT superfamily)
MLFNSPEFLFLFLPTTVLVFYLLGHRGYYRTAIFWLVLTSLFFYGYWNAAYLWLVIGSVLVNYTIGVWLTSYPSADRRRNFVLAFGVTLNLCLLAYFKYANFFLDSLSATGLTNIHLAGIILPLGISFFTFNQTMYLVDAWKGEAKEYNLLHYSVFVLFFPHLIAGPLIHHKEMVPQFTRDKIYRFSYFNLSLGTSIFLVGLFKKVVIADNLAPLATPVFNAAENGETLHMFQAWQGVIAYTFQLYFDFSGYSDMAIGLARMFGIYFPLNFNSPYKAVNIIDFWRRWHMTLSAFLRDYVYIPLGGSRKGTARRYINLMITMFLGGLWHGAGWTFVFWGLLHGLYLVINHVWRSVWKLRINTWWSTGIARLVTMTFVMLAWVFFRAESFEGAKNILAGMMTIPANLAGELGVVGDILVTIGFGINGPPVAMAELTALAPLLGWFVFVWFLPNTQQLFAKYQPAYDSKRVITGPTFLQTVFPNLYWKPRLPWSIAIGIVGGISLLSLAQVSEFLYYQF